MMVEHNQSANNGTNNGYNNAYKFNGKELDDATQMYYYGARYYDPRISIFVSVDPLAEQFVGWTPYHYVHQNPINLIDPTGMSAEGLDHDPPKEKAKGEKVLHIKYQGRDESIYENDDNILAKGYRVFKEMRKKSDEFLSGGFHFDDNDNKPKGDQSLRKKPMEGQKVQRIDVSAAMQGGSMAKAGGGIKYDSEDVKTTVNIYNNTLSAFNAGKSFMEGKVEVNTDLNWDIHYGGVTELNFNNTSGGKTKQTKLVFPVSQLPRKIDTLNKSNSERKYNESRFGKSGSHNNSLLR